MPVVYDKSSPCDGSCRCRSVCIASESFRVGARYPYKIDLPATTVLDLVPRKVLSCTRKNILSVCCTSSSLCLLAMRSFAALDSSRRAEKTGQGRATPQGQSKTYCSLRSSRTASCVWIECSLEDWIWECLRKRSSNFLTAPFFRNFGPCSQKFLRGRKEEKRERIFTRASPAIADAVRPAHG